MNSKHKPFTSLSRRQRRAETLRVKSRIKRERYPSSVFNTDCDISHAATMPGGWRWCDIVFLGADPATYWNATVDTASTHFASLVENAAFDEAFALLDADEQERQSSIETEPNYDVNGKIISHTWIRNSEPEYQQFGGLTLHAYLDKRELEIARDNPPAVYCGYRIEQGYNHGIGLHMVIDAPVLTVELIESAIADFIARGEKTWLAREPASVTFESGLNACPLKEC